MDVVIAMFLFLMALIVVLFQFKTYVYMVAGAYVEDALAASALASALIDVEEYGRSHDIRIADTRNAFWIYRDALYYNLALDEDGFSEKEELLTGKVRLERYIVYNVSGEEIQITSYDGEGNCLGMETALPGTIRTPDDVPVEHTTIYSCVNFQVKGMLDGIINARKEKSVDIVRCENGE